MNPEHTKGILSQGKSARARMCPKELELAASLFVGSLKMERNLSFCFEYNDDDESCPEVVHVTPDPGEVSDTELLLVANTCIHALAVRHGLEQALTIVNDAVYGKLANGVAFDTKWVDPDP